MSARITGLGHYQPERVLTNDELSSMVDTTDEWIVRRVGIRTRRIARPDETVAEMAAAAASMALARAGVEADEVDMVVLATATAAER